MILELDDSVFDVPNEKARRRLSSLIDYATERGHHVMHTGGDPIPDGSLAHKALLGKGAFDPRESEWIQAHLTQGFQAAQKPNTTRRIVRVHTGQTDWTSLPPTLSLVDARSYVVEPVWVIVENKENDPRFLEAWVPASRAGELADCQARHVLKFDHGGGLTGVSARIKAAHEKNDSSFLHRAVAFFDSDAAEPNKPSADAKKCRTECRKHLNKPFPRFHMLGRRAIENYFPHDLVETYATGKKGAHVHTNAVSVLRSLGIASMHALHYHMKKGLLVDFDGKSNAAKERRAAYENDTKQVWQHEDRSHLPEHWRNRSEAELGALLRGFSPGLTAWCLDLLASGHSHVFDGDAQDEAREAFAAILDWV